LQLQLKSMNSSAPISEKTREGLKGTPTICEDEFPALEGSSSKRAQPEPSQVPRLTPPLPSWRDKVSIPKPQTGMQLKFVPPLIENGKYVVQIESHNVVDLVNIWELAVVIYVVGGNVSTDIIRGYIRKHWSFVAMPVIHAHEEGYFILKFNNESECDEILNGGPYFLNKAPMIVKKWSSKFDFKEEILRVILVWIRLPSLPLHCWGEETLSRIVSAVGVPIIADDCTAKQLKVSYARVLVEVDITKEFEKEIQIRDNTGREFTQKVIPEWRPYYCRRCHKIGHECKDENDTLKPLQEGKSKEAGKGKEERKKWIPSSIVKLVQDVNNVEDRGFHN
jgi:uncharacterized protein DUF4283